MARDHGVLRRQFEVKSLDPEIPKVSTPGLNIGLLLELVDYALPLQDLHFDRSLRL